MRPGSAGGAAGGVAPSVTVAILTYNGEEHLDALLTAVEAQDYAGEIEILVIDSGSTDATLAIVGRHPLVRLHEIPNSEFGHGRTRTLAAELATGEFVAYLTHDAVPADDRWLAQLLAPMIDDERIAIVTGRQIARPGCPPILKYDIRRVFDRLGPDSGTTVFVDDGSLDEAALGRAAFHSDVSAAGRRALLTGAVPYRDVDYAEDQVLGRDVLAAGLRKAYAPRSVVEHSNDGTRREFGERIAADLRGLRAIGVPVAPVSRAAAFAQAVKWTILDATEIAVDPEYGALRRVRWLLANPLWHATKWSSYRRASRER